MNLRHLAAALALTVCGLDTAHGRTPKRVCRPACQQSVAACVASGARPRACRRTLIRACRRLGVGVCSSSTTTTPTFTTSTTTLSVSSVALSVDGYGSGPTDRYAESYRLTLDVSLSSVHGAAGVQVHPAFFRVSFDPGLEYAADPATQFLVGGCSGEQIQVNATRSCRLLFYLPGVISGLTLTPETLTFDDGLYRASASLQGIPQGPWVDLSFQEMLPSSPFVVWMNIGMRSYGGASGLLNGSDFFAVSRSGAVYPGSYLCQNCGSCHPGCSTVSLVPNGTSVFALVLDPLGEDGRLVAPTLTDVVFDNGTYVGTAHIRD